MNSSRLVASLVFIVSLAVSSAADVQWDNGAGDNTWFNAANWTGDVLPGTADNVKINLGSASRAIFSSGSASHNSIRLGDTAGGTGAELEVTGGNLTSTATIQTRIATGGRTATFNQSGGTVNFGGWMQIGLDANSVGNLSLSGGTLIALRNGTVSGVTAVSMSFGDGNNAQGNFILSGGELRTRTGILLGANGGRGRFEVRGAGVANIGTENGADDGFWVQSSNSVLAAYVTNGSLGTIFIDNLGGASGTYSDGNVIFMPGAKLEVGFLGTPMTNAWDLMTWEGALLTNGLSFAASVTDTNWSFEFVDTGGSAGPDTLRLRYGPPPPPPGPGIFVHPGVMHTLADLERMRTNVLAGNQPWLDGYNALIADSRSSASYSMQGPFGFVTRSPIGSVNLGQWENDCGAAYQNALLWALTSNAAHANKAIQILNAWSSTLTNINGSDARLTAGLQGHKFICAAEIIRHTGAGWSQAQVNVCSNFIRSVLLPLNRMYGGGNWGNIGAISQMAAGVFLEDETEFNQAVSAIKFGAPTECDMGLPNYIHSLGWTTEADRDIGHWALGLNNAAVGAQIAWCQGVDLWTYLNNRIHAGHEYLAKYNLSNAVPYSPGPQCDGYNNGGITSEGRGRWDLTFYEQAFHPYQNMLGVESPWTWAAITNTRAFFATNHGDGFQAERYDRDHVGFGTLVAALPPRVAGLPQVPRGLLAIASNGVVELSWSAAPDASNYQVKRATRRGGPYISIAAGLTAPTFIDSTVTNGQVLFYKVEAANGVGESGDSGLASAFPSGTAPAPPTGVRAEAISHQRIDLSWKASPGAVSYNVKRGVAAEGPFTNLASQVGTSFLSFADASLPAATAYHYVVTANNAMGSSEDSEVASAATLPALPVPWAYADAGYVTTPGHAIHSNGVFVVRGAGLDYGGANSDSFGFAYVSLTGNGEIMARLASRTNYSHLSKIGLALRESLDNESKHAFVMIDGRDNAGFVFRSSTGGNGSSSGSTNVSGLALPCWLKLNRAGNVFTGSVSEDGTNWTVIHSRSISMNGTLLAGLAVCSRNNGFLDTAVFDSVSVSGIWPPRPGTPDGLNAVPGDGEVRLSWSASANATGYNVKQSTVPGGSYNTIAADWSSLTLTNAGLSNGVRYYFVVSGTNAFGESADSMEVSARPVSRTPMQVIAAPVGNALQFDWPATHIGWRLEMQTNALGVGLSNNWLTVDGSNQTNQLQVPLAGADGTAFFRLVYP